MGLAGWLFAAVYDRMTAGAEAAGIGAYREHLLSGLREGKHLLTTLVAAERDQGQ